MNSSLKAEVLMGVMYMSTFIFVSKLQIAVHKSWMNVFKREMAVPDMIRSLPLKDH